MKDHLLNAFSIALNNYCTQSPRGYRMGFFSALRHDFTKNATLTNLEREIKESKTDEAALDVVVSHLLAKGATFNNHSFNAYFIDALKSSALNTIDWDCFTPKAIKKYQGPVYRGTSQPPQKIFNEGFRELEQSDQVEDYLKFRNQRIGISTSKEMDVAKEYALNSRRSGRTRYVYAINYRGDAGFDVLSTGKARGVSFHALWHRDRLSGFRKQEVNVRGVISRADVVGAWEVGSNDTLKWIDNPRSSSEVSPFEKGRLRGIYIK